MKPLIGTCLCGKVAFEVTGTPLKFLYCHCRSCQKSTGSIHAANLAFPAGSVRWTQGEDLLQLFVDTKENPGFPRCFCKSCGSPLPKLSRNQQFWVVPSGSLDSDPGIKPQANIYWAEHAPWYVSADQLPRHDGRFVDQDGAASVAPPKRES
ncbi:MAG TPA: GFA family protein [Verrucomicrobiae bacterium]